MRREHVFIVIAALFYGSVVAGGEYFLQKGFSLFEIALYPISLMTLLLLPILIFRPQYSIPFAKIPFFVVYGLIGAFAEIGQFVGLVFDVPVAVVALALYTQPLWTMLLSSALLNEPITGRKLSAATLAFMGVTILMFGSWTLEVTHPFTGLLASLIASVFISLWVIWGRKSGISEQHYITTTIGWGAFTSLWLLIMLPVVSTLLTDPTITRLSMGFSKSDWVALLLFAIAGGIIPSFCFFKGLRVVDASVAGIILLLEPISAAFLAAIFFSQSLDATTFAGGALILLANYVISREPGSTEIAAGHTLTKADNDSAEGKAPMSNNTSSRRVAKWPNGFRLRRTFKNHSGWIGRIAWSPDGELLASGSDDRTIYLSNPVEGTQVRKLEGHSDTVFSVAWSRDGKLLASSSDDETIRLWNPNVDTSIRTLTGHTSGVVSVTWLADNLTLASGGGDKSIRIWNAATGALIDTLDGHTAWIRQLTVSPNAETLASASYDGTVRLWNLRTRKCTATLEGHGDRVHSAVWAPDGDLLASASADFTIRIWSAAGKAVKTLDGHTGAVYDLSFSHDGRWLASKSLDNSVRIWNCDTWICVSALREESVATDFGGLAFHPERTILATLGDYDTVVRVWDIDPSGLSNESLQRTSSYTSAKIVLVGESNVGKSCLALRLAEDRYEEQPTTHGMRFWVLTPDQLSPTPIIPHDESRDIVLWDMGGQDEYRLIHQIFLHDTTVAVLLFDPTRGRTAIEEVEGWNRRLEKQLHGRQVIKLLVGTKMDDTGSIVDKTLIDRLISDCGFSGYYSVSSKFGRGMAEFREALYQAINWELLTRTSGPELLHQIHRELEMARSAGEAVLPMSELGLRLIDHGSTGTVSQEAINAAIEQLALQGLIASTTLASGDRALVLQIEEVERYGGSLILAARANPRGIPAIEERTISSRQMVFPRIYEGERISWLQERAVLECVIQLLIEHDICLRHEGLLVFPSLFLPSEISEEANIPRGVALHYDFTGAIDNIYASLVAKLSLSSKFGRYRLWENRAEWESAEQGACGVRKVSYKSGVGHIDVYFSDQGDPKRRELFMVFVEDHLRQHGVEITETIQISCACGNQFQDEAVRARLAAGWLDIICSVCEVRNRISEGALQIRSSDPSVEKSLIALKTVIEKRRRNDVEKAISTFRRVESSGGPVVILHLSDLHMSSESDLHPGDMLQQLLADLRDQRGLAFESLDYLFVTGDLTTCASPDEFEKAYQFISGIIEAFQLNAARCVIVPGNHDIDWNEPVYEWKSNRQVNLPALREGTYVRQGNGVLVRDDQRYPRRFKNFSDQFYMFLRQEEYPLDFDKQAIPFLFPESGIQLLALNSCWEIDEFFPNRASIYGQALGNGLTAADSQIKTAQSSGDLSADSKVLRLAIWHHPVTGNEKINDDAFLDRLRQADFKLCLHGHVHEERADLIGYTHPARHIFVAGAGSFGAPASQRPEAVPRLYNVLEIADDRSEIKVHTRCLRNPKGAWDGWAVWEGRTPQERLTYYRIKIEPTPAAAAN